MIPPGDGRIADLNLFAWELLLRARAGDGTGPSGEVRWLLARYALTAPVTAVRLPMVRAALAPEVRAAVTRLARQASHAAVSAVPGGMSAGADTPGTMPGTRFGTAAAARLLGVETHAVRAAARRQALTGGKDDGGRWTFTRADVEAYDRRRHHGG